MQPGANVSDANGGPFWGDVRIPGYRRVEDHEYPLHLCGVHDRWVWQLHMGSVGHPSRWRGIVMAARLAFKVMCVVMRSDATVNLQRNARTHPDLDEEFQRIERAFAEVSDQKRPSQEGSK